MEKGLTEKLDWINQSFAFFIPELILGTSIIFILVLGLILKKKNSAEENPNRSLFSSITFLFVLGSLLFQDWSFTSESIPLFVGMIRTDHLTSYLKILIDVAALLTIIMTWQNKSQARLTEYFALILSIVLGAHLLLMSINFIMVFLSLEVISICSYVLAGFVFNKKGSEASLKYFLFGSVASAIMLYGLSILFGITGSLDFTSTEFANQLLGKTSPLIFTSGLMVLAGFIYKIAAVPMHPWSPDIYEASPMPIVAFFSVVPKLAGLGILIKFLSAINLLGRSAFDWQLVISVVSILSITFGNFSALRQKNAKRMMAYSSIAQSGFLLIGVSAFLPNGIHFMLFYATIYMVANFIVFIILQYFESHNIHTIAEYVGVGKSFTLPSILLLIALLSLTGLPPTSGFTAKLFVFSSLWEAYSFSDKPVLLLLFIFGLLNTVVSLFYYLRIPYLAFLKSNESIPEQNKVGFENLLALILVIVILILFFLPGMLMGWINKITFVL